MSSSVRRAWSRAACRGTTRPASLRAPAPGAARASPRSPSVDGFDVLIYTGSGLMGREITDIRTCDIVVIVGGRIGTLGEFAIAYDEGRLIGVLTGRRNHRPHPRDHQPPFGLPYEGAQHPATAGVIAVALRDPWGSTALKTPTNS